MMMNSRRGRCYRFACLRGVLTLNSCPFHAPEAQNSICSNHELPLVARNRTQCLLCSPLLLLPSCCRLLHLLFPLTSPPTAPLLASPLCTSPSLLPPLPHTPSSSPSYPNLLYQLLSERGELATRFGSATLGILLLQVHLCGSSACSGYPVLGATSTAPACKSQARKAYNALFERAQFSPCMPTVLLSFLNRAAGLRGSYPNL